MMMRKTSTRLAVAGLAVAGASAVLPAQAVAGPSTVLPTQAAPAAPTQPVAAQDAAKRALFSAKGHLPINPATNRIGAWGKIQDLTPGRDFVAVQAFIQRYFPGRGWVTVVRGPRDTGNNFAKSVITSRPCTNGKVYRVYVNYNWNNVSRFPAAGRPKVC
jgi:hypothetical protein